MLRRAITAAIGGIALSAAVASAAPTLTVSPVYVGTASSATATTWTPRADPQGTATPTGQFDKYELRFSISGLEPGQDFAGTGLNINWAGITVGTTYSAVNPKVAVGEDDFGPIESDAYSQNGDLATARDLKDILVAVARDVASVREFGEAGRNADFIAPDNLGTPTTFGSIVTRWDGVTPATISISPNAGPADAPFTIWTNNANGTGTGVNAPVGSVFEGGSVTFVPIPEPTSAALLGVGALLLTVRRRRA